MRCRASAIGCTALTLSALLLWMAQPLAESLPTNGYVVGSGAWEGGGIDDAEGHFSFCYLVGPTLQGDTISFTFDPDGTLELALDADLWPGERESGLDVRVVVDGASHRTVSERVEGLLVFEIARDLEFLAALKETSGVSLVAGGELLYLPLDGHARIALGEMEDCLEHFTGIELTEGPEPPTTDGVSTEAGETGYQIDVGPWTGGGFADESGFASCGIARRVESFAIVIGLAPDRSLTIVLGAEEWKRSVVGGQRNLVMRVDSTAERWVTATGVEGKLIAELGQDNAFFEALKRGNRLVIEGAPQEIGFKLKPDAREALTALEDCYVQHTGFDLGGNPIDDATRSSTVADDESEASAAAPPAGLTAGSTAGSASAAEPLTAAAAEAIVRDLLDEAGYPEPIFARVAEGKSLFTLAWMSAEDAPPGFLATWRHDPQSYRDALRRRIKSVGEICDGEPTYGPSADAQSGTAVYSGVIECADEDFGRGYFTAGVTSGDVALLFLHFSGPLDEAIGRQINATLRQSLLSY